jgi:hypothetical protein
MQTFTSLSSLSPHDSSCTDSIDQSHTGHRPFQCKMCQQNFSEAATLQQHMRRHTQESLHSSINVIFTNLIPYLAQNLMLVTILDVGSRSLSLVPSQYINGPTTGTSRSNAPTATGQLPYSPSTHPLFLTKIGLERSQNHQTYLNM